MNIESSTKIIIVALAVALALASILWLKLPRGNVIETAAEEVIAMETGIKITDDPTKGLSISSTTT